jgi:hypothetical protein
LLCGWDSPLGDTDPGASVVVGTLEVNASMLKALRPCPWPSASARPAAGNLAVALSWIAGIVWLWLGICVSSNVTLSSPPVSPMSTISRPGTLALAPRYRTLEVGQREIARAVAAVLGAEQREQRGVLRDGQNLPLAKCPADWREVECKQSNFGDKWVHRDAPYRSRPPRPATGVSVGRCSARPATGICRTGK